MDDFSGRLDLYAKTIYDGAHTVDNGMREINDAGAAGVSRNQVETAGNLNQQAGILHEMMESLGASTASFMSRQNE